jgi:hypothetical protein
MHQKVKKKERKVVKSMLIGKSKLTLFKVNVKINNQTVDVEKYILT